MGCDVFNDDLELTDTTSQTVAKNMIIHSFVQLIDYFVLLIA